MFKKFFRTVDRSLGFVEEWSLVIVVLVALCSAMANIILRKTTNISLYWSDEVVRKTIFFSTYLGCSAAIRQRSLIRIDALPQIFPVLRKFLNFINHVAVIFFSGLLVWLGWGMTMMVYQDEFARTTTLQIPEWYFYAVLPIVGVMMFIRTLLVMVEDLRAPKDSSEKPN